MTCGKTAQSDNRTLRTPPPRARPASATYADLVASHRHHDLAVLPAYPALRRALADLADQARAALAEFVRAVGDMSCTTPYADCCPACQAMTWPHAVERERDWLRCEYHCQPCRRSWRCGYAVNLPGLTEGPKT